MLKQVNGGYMAHLEDFLKPFNSAALWEEAGFAVTDATVKMVADDVHTEDQFSDHFGQAGFHIIGFRARRNFGTPARVAEAFATP